MAKEFNCSPMEIEKMEMEDFLDYLNIINVNNGIAKES